MQRQILIASHLGSGASMLIEMLLASRRIAKLYREPGLTYSEPATLTTLQKIAKQHHEYASIFVDKLSFNYEVTNNVFFDICDWIILIRRPVDCLTHLIESHLYSPKKALDYYCFRLRRLCEMARKIRRKLIVTWDELVDKSSFTAIKKYMGLRELTSIYRQKNVKSSIDSILIAQGERCYDRHLHYLASLPGLWPR